MTAFRRLYRRKGAPREALRQAGRGPALDGPQPGDDRNPSVHSIPRPEVSVVSLFSLPRHRTHYG